MEGILATQCWRREPLVIPGAVPRSLISGYNSHRVSEIVSQVPCVRVFSTEVASQTPGAPASRLIPRPASSTLFSKLLRSGITYTVLINDIDTVDSNAVSVRDFFGVPFKWRVDDIVLTWSTTGSGIGYHAGHEDALIVQVAGRRRWRAWSADNVSADFRRRLLLSDPGDNVSLTRTTSQPLLDCELNPGDALYLPPFCPHEGITLESSVSMALGWRGVAYFHFVDALSGLVHTPSGVLPRDLPDDFFSLVPDFDHTRGSESQLSTAEAIAAAIIAMGCDVTDATALAHRINATFAEPCG